jgi:hypothetical protein
MTVISTLIVTRPRGPLTTRLSGCTITVDGKVRGTVRAGASLSVAVPPGAHTVQARLGRHPGADNPVHLGPGATVRLRLDTSGHAPRLVPADQE